MYTKIIINGLQFSKYGLLEFRMLCVSHLSSTSSFSVIAVIFENNM